MLRASLVFLLSLSSFGAARAAAPDHPDVRGWLHAGCAAKQAAAEALARRDNPDLAPIDRADRPLDVQHVDLRIVFPDSFDRITATMRARVVVLESTGEVVFDLESESTQSLGLTVNEVRVEGAPTTFTHGADTLAVALPAVLAAGDTTTVAVDYAGMPLPGRSPGFGLRFTNFIDEDFQPDPELPVAQTLSQPVSARTWWPCHDHPADAATVRLTVEMPADFELAAPGIRESIETRPDGRVVQTNVMPTPVPSYLVSLIVADFERWTEPITVTELLDDGTTVPRTIDLVHYAPTRRRDDAEYSWSNTASMMDRFEALWGPYPYADIKYGNALFNGAVAMEHPTMSSIGDSPFTVSGEQSTLYPGPVGDLVNAHELAHMWFGNAVRLERWGDIWLNEGFARYAETLWLEEFYGPEFAADYRAILREGSDFWSGPLRDPSPTALFSGVTYDKGALVLHMLRQVLGRDDFFAAMRNYVTDAALRFGAVTVEDFRAHCEAVYGGDLGWFFDPWLTREELPTAIVDWWIQGSEVDLRVRQPADNVYEIPLPVRLELADGTTEDETVWIGRGQEDFTLRADAEVVGVTIDPDDAWLLEVETPARPRIAFERVYPNPFNPNVRIEFVVGDPGAVRLEVVDARGRLVRTLRDESLGVGRYEAAWDGRDDAARAVASGVYHVRLEAGGLVEARKVTLLR